MRASPSQSIVAPRASAMMRIGTMVLLFSIKGATSLNCGVPCWVNWFCPIAKRIVGTSGGGGSTG